MTDMLLQPGSAVKLVHTPGSRESCQSRLISQHLYSHFHGFHPDTDFIAEDPENGAWNVVRALLSGLNLESLTSNFS